MLGRIQSVDWLGDVVAILDGFSKQVVLFRTDGSLLTTVSRSGEGPGEFEEPLWLSLGSDERLAVGEMGSEAELFEGLGRPRHEGKVRTAGAVYSLCHLRDALVLQTWHPVENTVIEVIGSAGDRRRFGRFVEGVSDGPSSIGHGYAEGRVACLEEHSLVVLGARSVIPRLEAYRLDGERVWVDSIAGYVPLNVTEVSGGFHASVPRDGYHRLFSLTHFRGFVIAQFAFLTLRTLQEQRDFERLHTLILDPTSGEGAAVGTQVPPILASTGTCIATLAPTVHPAVELRCPLSEAGGSSAPRTSTPPRAR